MAGKNDGSHVTPPGERSYRGSVGGASSVSTVGPGRWAVVDPIALAECVAAVAGVGGGLLLGVTRDGGSAALTLFYADDRVRFYPSTDDELHALLRDLQFWSKLASNRRLLSWFKT